VPDADLDAGLALKVVVDGPVESLPLRVVEIDQLRPFDCAERTLPRLNSGRDLDFLTPGEKYHLSLDIGDEVEDRRKDQEREHQRRDGEDDDGPERPATRLRSDSHS
jgi:hypothetical protein